MGTRSTISLKQTDGKYKSIYCHFDGYLSNNGEILYNHYKTYDKIEALLNLGQVSSLKPSIECPAGHSYDSPVDGCTIFYTRDRGEKDCSFEITDTFADADKNEFNYLYEDGVWFVEYTKYTDEDGKEVYETLRDALLAENIKIDDSKPEIKEIAERILDEYICIDNKGIEGQFTEGENYVLCKGLSDHEMINLYDNDGIVRECFTERFRFLRQEINLTRGKIKELSNTKCDKCGLFGVDKNSSDALCPYQHDVNNCEVSCNCCDECRYQCAQDI